MSCCECKIYTMADKQNQPATAQAEREKIPALYWN